MRSISRFEGDEIGTSCVGAMTVAEQVVEYTSSIRYDELPQAVVEKAQLAIRDGIGNQLSAFGSRERPAEIALGLFRHWGGTEEATVVGYGDRLPVANAALVGAMLGHGVELDDAHANALTKSGASIIPTGLAVGEMVGSDGRDLIAAIVAGYEVMIRIGLSINPSHRQRGYHTSGTVAPFAAAVITSRLLNLDAKTSVHAVGLAGMQSAGIQAYLGDPCMAKPFSPGKGAYNGVLAALLARDGMTGPRSIFEGPEGFLEAYADASDPSLITAHLGTEFRILEVAFKPHAACRYAHGPIDAAQALHETHALTARDIRRVTVSCSELAIRQSGHKAVTTVGSAMGSTPFGVALALTVGSNQAEDYASHYQDDELRELLDRVDVVSHHEAGLMGRQAVVHVELSDGRTLRHESTVPRGEPQNPLSDIELEAKFVRMATKAVGESRASTLAGSLLSWDDVGDVRDVMPSLIA